LVIVSEGIRLLLSMPGDEFNAKEFIARYLKDAIDGWSHENKPDVRVQELGYPVRGADPCRFDMILGAELGSRAVTCLIAGKTEIMLGWSRQNGIVETGFGEVAALSNRPPGEIWADRQRWQELLELHEVLTRPPG
jgi:6-phosphofructokinase